MSTLKVNSIEGATGGEVDINATLGTIPAIVISGVTTVSAGTTSAPAITPSGDSNTGIFFPSADTIAFAEGGVEAARFDSSGRLGIGTVPPTGYSAKLTVASNAVSSGGGSADGGIVLTSTTSLSTGQYAPAISFSPNPAAPWRSRAGIAAVSNDATNGMDLVFLTRFAADGTELTLSTNEKLRITSGGTVGVGTTNPNSNSVLDVNGTQFIVKNALYSNESSAGLYVRGNRSSGTVGLILGADNTTGIAYIQPLQAGTTYSQNMSICAMGGNTGIGLTNPSVKVHISDSVTSVGATGTEVLRIANTRLNTGSSAVALRFVNNEISGTNQYTRAQIAAEYDGTSNNNGRLMFATADTNGVLQERARLDGSGRLLVGATSARSVSGQTHLVQFESVNSSPFSGVSIVNNANDGNGSYLILGKSRGTSAGSNTVVNNADQIGGIFFAAADGSNINGSAAGITCNIDAAPGAGDVPGRLMFSTTADGASSPTERVRIINSGYFKASSTGGYNNSTGAYHEFRQGAVGNEILVMSHTGSSGPYGINMAFTGASPNDTTSYFLYCADSTAQRATIRSNGGLANYSANNANLSDRNAKKDISPAADTWNCIKEWEIVNYRYKDQPDDADLNLGVIAQQVAEHCPEIITVFQEAKEATETEPAQEERLGIKEQQMYWMAIKALQEAQVRIEQLEAKVAALEAK